MSHPDAAATSLTRWLAGRTVKDQLGEHLEIVLDELKRLQPFEKRCRTLILERNQARAETFAVQEKLAALQIATATAPFADRTMVRVAEVAAAARVSNMTIYRLIHSGQLRAIKVGRSLRVNQQEAIALLNNGVQIADKPEPGPDGEEAATT